MPEQTKNPKRIAISVGPIPARLDSVKFITNRFKGRLAIKTAYELALAGHEVTIVAWKYTQIPSDIMAPEPYKANGEITTCPGVKNIVRISDVFEYYDWFVANANNYDAFVMAGAVANLTPVKPYEGKFPSHNYKPGDEFDIKFMIAPRAIDAIKPLNPRACLIGYKLFDADTDQELIDIARHTLADAKANLIFANTPAEAKSRKIAITSDGAAIDCTFDEHNELIKRAVEQEYFKTEIQPLTLDEINNPDIREAMAIVSMFEKTFVQHGTTAIPVKNHPGMFATTTRGHKANTNKHPGMFLTIAEKREAVIIRSVDPETRTIIASDKATLNAPALSAMLEQHPGHIVIHRHFDDANAADTSSAPSVDYLFPGTLEEYKTLKHFTGKVLNIKHHGYMQALPIQDVDWNKYREIFPKKYFGIPHNMWWVLEKFEGMRTLEIGGNINPTGQFCYDPYVKTNKAINLCWSEVANNKFALGFAKNAINYLTLDEIKTVLENCDAFIANTFCEPPIDCKITDCETAVRDGDMIYHTLRLKDDSIMQHSFHAHRIEDYEALGLSYARYAPNSMLVFKNVQITPKNPYV